MGRIARLASSATRFRLVAEVAGGANLTEAGKAVGIPRATMSRHRKADPEFEALLQQAMELQDRSADVREAWLLEVQELMGVGQRTPPHLRPGAGDERARLVVVPDPREFVVPEVIDEDEERSSSRTGSRKAAPPNDPPPPPEPPLCPPDEDVNTDVGATRDLDLRVADRHGRELPRLTAANLARYFWRVANDPTEPATLRKHAGDALKDIAFRDTPSRFLPPPGSSISDGQPDAKGLTDQATSKIMNMIAGSPPTECPACKRKIWESSSGGLSPHYDEEDPRASGWARPATHAGADGLCPGIHDAGA